MFGFDVIRDIKSNRYSVIDINFFPGIISFLFHFSYYFTNKMIEKGLEG